MNPVRGPVWSVGVVGVLIGLFAGCSPEVVPGAARSDTASAADAGTVLVGTTIPLPPNGPSTIEDASASREAVWVPEAGAGGGDRRSGSGPPPDATVTIDEAIAATAQVTARVGVWPDPITPEQAEARRRALTESLRSTLAGRASPEEIDRAAATVVAAWLAPAGARPFVMEGTIDFPRRRARMRLTVAAPAGAVDEVFDGERVYVRAADLPWVVVEGRDDSPAALEILDQLRSAGPFSVIATGMIRDRPALVLRGRRPDGGTTEVWVDRATHRITQIRRVAPSSAQSSGTELNMAGTAGAIDLWDYGVPVDAEPPADAVPFTS